MIGKTGIDNIIRIGSVKSISAYFEGVLMRGQPRIYNKYNCIKLRFTKNVQTDVFYLLQMFWHFGIECIEIKRMSEALPVDGGRVMIEECYEATLKKIGAIQFEDNSEYTDKMKKLWENRNGSN